MNRLLRRAFDFSVATIALIVFVPLLCVIAFALRANMGSPILFRQVRPGYKGMPFTLLKFRTMTNARGPDGRLLPDGARLTRVGVFLRRFSLDELPELWNVLRGEMSLVGPRPLLMEYLDRYSPEQARRHDVKPGITGWAQVNGRNALSWEQKFAFDIWYVENWCLLLDLQILAQTFWRVLKGEGICQQSHATMPEFLGSERIGPL
jgi:sugar transferase EpsL